MGKDNSIISSTKQLGINLNFLRDKENMRLYQFQNRIGYGRNYLTNLELGTQNIKLDTLVSIASHLDKDVGMLLSRRFKTERDCRNCKFTECDYYLLFIKNVKVILDEQNIRIGSISCEHREKISKILELKKQSNNESIVHKNPTISSLEEIANAINTPLEQLLTMNPVKDFNLTEK